MLLKLLFLLIVNFGFADENNTNSQNVETLRNVTREALSGDRLVCEDVRNLAVGNRPQNQIICETYWPKQVAIVVTAKRPSSESTPDSEIKSEATVTEIGVPQWSDTVREKPQSVDKHSAAFEGDKSPEQMANEGKTLATPGDLQTMETSFVSLRNGMADRCCGTNSECLSSFKAVRIQFCTNPRAVTHPNEPDRCTGRDSGFYTTTGDEHIMRWWNLYILSLPQNHHEPNRAALLQKYPQLRGRLGSVAPGFISVSRYDRADQLDTQWTFRHELGHACSSIRRQMAVRDSTQLRAGDDYNPDPKELCRYKEGGYQQFTFLGEYLRPENSRAVGTCLSTAIRNEVRNKNDQAYMRNACYGSKIEEGIAETFALLTADKDQIFQNLNNSCSYPPSPVHFSGYKIIQCLVENSPQFRNKILAAPVCREPQPSSTTATQTEAGAAATPFMNQTLLSTPAPDIPPPPVTNPYPSPAPSSQEGQE